jgi:acetamidase/formamidase
MTASPGPSPTRMYALSSEPKPQDLLTRTLPLPGCGHPPGTSHWYLPASDKTVHWGYFSKNLRPILEVASGDYVTIECLTHCASDDYERMIKGDPGAESVFYWTKNQKNVNRRGAGSLDASIGAGGGGAEGAHICTGPIYVREAAPGDVLEVHILDMYPRPCANPAYKNKAFGSNVIGSWGFHAGHLVEEPKDRETVTIFEFDATGEQRWAQAVYSFRWAPVIDPNGVMHPKYDYVGLVIDHKHVQSKEGILKNVRIPLRPHFGVLGVAPKEADMVNTVPPSYTGGNVDNWRSGKGATLYYPVAVEGALLSAGDTHAAQGDGEICGAAIESSWTGVLQLILHKRGSMTPHLEGLNYPLLETAKEWVVHGFSFPNYLGQLRVEDKFAVFTKSTLDLAMRDAYTKMRDLLMRGFRLSEDEAIALMAVSVDFGLTQIVNGNIGMHAILQKSVFATT